MSELHTERLVLRPWAESDAELLGWRVAVEGSTAIGFIALNYLGEGTAGLSPEEFEPLRVYRLTGPAPASP